MADGVRVKICGLVRREDVLAADEAGAHYLGVVLSAGFGRSVDPSWAAALVAGTHGSKVAVLVDETPEAAEAAGEALGADVLQLHGDEPPETLEALRSSGTWGLWKAVRARSLDDVDRAVERYGHLAEGILVEGWRDGPLGVGGARVGLDPAEVRARVPAELTFILAGGLRADSVGDAVQRFGPDVVDVSSGVEKELGVKDGTLIASFLREARVASRVAGKGAR